MRKINCCSHWMMSGSSFDKSQFYFIFKYIYFQLPPFCGCDRIIGTSLFPWNITFKILRRIYYRSKYKADSFTNWNFWFWYFFSNFIDRRKGVLGQSPSLITWNKWCCIYFSQNWSLNAVQLHKGEQLPLRKGENMKSTFWC